MISPREESKDATVFVCGANALSRYYDGDGAVVTGSFVVGVVAAASAVSAGTVMKLSARILAPSQRTIPATPNGTGREQS